MQNPTFIETYSNILTAKECNEIIDYFEKMRKHKIVFSRQELKDGLGHEKSDETVFLMEPETLMMDRSHPVLGLLLERVHDCYKKYAAKYSILMQSKNHGVSSIRLQRTDIGGGYHNWHYENDGRLMSHRFLAFTVYLNNVLNGGETEYLYQNERCLAIQGRVTIWPAAFTHPHRGNPPISGPKYIATGWIEFIE